MRSQPTHAVKEEDPGAVPDLGDRLPPEPRAAGSPVNRALALVGLVTAGLGLTVIAGWHIQNLHLIQVLPGLTPMAYRTAVCFVATAIAFLGVSTGRGRRVIPLAIVVGALSLTSVVEFASGISVPVDRLLMAPETTSRMAPNTAVSFAALAGALLLMILARPSPRRAAAIALLASVANATGVISLVGYITGFEIFAWGGMIPMALNTAAGIFLLGTVLLAYAWRDSCSPGALPPWLDLAVAFAAVVVTLSVWQALATEDRVRFEHLLDATTDQVTRYIGAQMQSRVAAVVQFARRWDHGEPIREGEWAPEARLLLDETPGYKTVAWVDAKGHVRWVYPRESSGELFSNELPELSQIQAASAAAGAKRQPVFTRPIVLHGNREISLFVPVLRDAAFSGYMAARFAVSDLLSRIVSPDLARGFAIEIVDGDQPLYARPREFPVRDRGWERRSAIDLQTVRWTVRVWPTAESFAPPVLSRVVLGAGLLLSLLLGAAVRFAQAATGRTQIAEGLKASLEVELAERQRAEEELDRFFTLSPDMLCIAGPDGFFKRLNPAWTRSLGWPADQLKSQPFLDLVHPDDLSATREAVRRQENGEPLAAFENRYRTKEGSFRWLHWNSLREPDRGLIYAAARDVTSEKEAVEAIRRSRDELDERVKQRTTELEQSNCALRQSEALFRRLFEDSPFGAALVGTDHKLNRVNKAFCDLLGYSAAELVGLTTDQIVHGEEVEAGRQLFDGMTCGENSGFRVPRRYVRKDGEVIWAELTGTVIRDGQGGVLTAMGIVENVTERRNREEQISRLNCELATRVSDLTALNQELEAFNYSIAHDLRAPLRHQDAFSRILEEDYGHHLPADGRNCIHRVRDAARRMGRMVDDLLELSRTSRQPVERESTDLKSLVEDVIAELQSDVTGREIEWRVGALPLVECDPAMIRQVLFNLLSNAVKFTRGRMPAMIEVGVASSKEPGALYVRDNGVGFSMKYAGKLFGVFQRLHRREDFEGTGVGLATVQRIIGKHGGRIWAEAEVDQGATFFFTLAPPAVAPAGGIRQLNTILREEEYAERPS